MCMSPYLSRLQTVDSGINVYGVRAENGEHPHVHHIRHACTGIGRYWETASKAC